MNKDVIVSRKKMNLFMQTALTGGFLPYFPIFLV